MKHLFNISRILFWFCIRIVLIVLGVIILPVFVNFRKPSKNDNKFSNQEKFSIEFIDKIYGNEEDGFGDIYYKRDYPKDTYFSRYIWCAWRNPTHNFVKIIGVRNKVVIKSIIKGNPNVTDDPYEENTGLKFQEVITKDGKYYPMYYYCILWRQILPFYKGDRGIRLLMGWKNFCVKPKQKLPKKFDYSMTCTINPIKLFVKG